MFGKLLEWERSGSESGEGPVDDAPADDSDLREHVVGILFAGHQLTSLQREVRTYFREDKIPLPHLIIINQSFKVYCPVIRRL